MSANGSNLRRPMPPDARDRMDATARVGGSALRRGGGANGTSPPSSVDRAALPRGHRRRSSAVPARGPSRTLRPTTLSRRSRRPEGDRSALTGAGPLVCRDASDRFEASHPDDSVIGSSTRRIASIHVGVNTPQTKILLSPPRALRAARPSQRSPVISIKRSDLISGSERTMAASFRHVRYGSGGRAASVRPRERPGRCPGSLPRS